MKKLLILGAGGYGKTIADLARQLGCFDKIAFLDDGKARSPGVLGTCGEIFSFADEDTQAYPAFGNNDSRIWWIAHLRENGIPVPTLVHPDAYVSPTAVLGDGVAVLPKAVVNTGVTVKDGCILNIGSLTDHDVVLEEGCHLAPGAIVKAGNRIPSRMKVESGTVIQNGEYPL